MTLTSQCSVVLECSIWLLFWSSKLRTFTNYACQQRGFPCGSISSLGALGGAWIWVWEFVRRRPKIWIFSNPIFLRVFEKWNPDIFQKSQIFRISFSSHSENAHIKLNGFQSWFGGWGDMPFIFFMGWNGQKSENGPSPHPPPELFIHPVWGNR